MAANPEIPDSTDAAPTAGSQTLPVDHRRITKRLMPLYVGAFLQGFVLWYAVEKLFMTTIGFDDATIGLMVAVYSAAMLLVETPSGIMADRWSRKGVLILGSVALLLSSLVGGLSHSLPVYLISSVLWGIFYALYSGTFDSIIYDTLEEETGHARGFDYYLGRVRLVDSSALVIGSLAGGVLATVSGDLRLPYFMTIVPCALSIIALILFREPQLHKSNLSEPIITQVRTTFRAVIRSRTVLWIVAINILLAVILQFYYEFEQLWLIALVAPTVLYGVVNALLLSGGGIGGILAGKFNLRRRRYMAPLLILLVVSSTALTFARNLTVVIIHLTIVCIIASTVAIVYTSLLHDQLSSNIRAGAASAVSSLSRIILIPGALFFGWQAKSSDIFAANWINIILLLVACSLIAVTLLYPKSEKPQKAP